MLADIHKTGVSAGLSIADYSDVQAAATEILKIDGDAVVINTIMMHEIFAQAADKFFHLLIGRVVGQSQHKIKPSFFTFTEIGDGRVGEQGVGDIDKFLWKVRRQVLRKVIFSTVPSMPLAEIQSPITKGLSMMMTRLPNTLARESLAARATASEPILKLAINPVIS